MIAAVLDLHEGAGVAGETVYHVGSGLAQLGDRIHLDFFFAAQAEIAVARGGELFRIAQDEIDLGHAGKHCGIDLGGAAGNDEARTGAARPRTANGLARLAHRLRGHRTSVEDDGIAEAGAGRSGANDFRLVGVEAAAEGHHFEPIHAGAMSIWPGKNPSNS